MASDNQRISSMLVELASFKLRFGYANEAFELLKSASMLTPENKDIIALQASAALTQGHYQKCLELIEKISDAPPEKHKAMLAMLASYAKLKLGQVDDAKEMFKNINNSEIVE